MVLNKAQVEPEAGKGPKKLYQINLTTTFRYAGTGDLTSSAGSTCLFDSHMPAEEESISPIYANHPWLSFEVNFQFDSVNYSV